MTVSACTHTIRIISNANEDLKMSYKMKFLKMLMREIDDTKDALKQADNAKDIAYWKGALRAIEDIYKRANQIADVQQ